MRSVTYRNRNGSIILTCLPGISWIKFGPKNFSTFIFINIAYHHCGTYSWGTGISYVLISSSCTSLHSCKTLHTLVSTLLKQHVFLCSQHFIHCHFLCKKCWPARWEPQRTPLISNMCSLFRPSFVLFSLLLRYSLIWKVSLCHLYMKYKIGQMTTATPLTRQQLSINI